MSADHLLPANSSPLEKAVSETLDCLPAFGPYVVEAHGFKFERPLNTTIAPSLVIEYGLGSVSRFFDTIEGLIDGGVPWQRLRGTPAAVETALEWIDYGGAAVRDEYASRRKWNRYQIAMGELPPGVEATTLADAEYLAGLSDPVRSVFFRGYHEYDYRALIASQGKTSETLWGDDTGVRIGGGAVKWSHGREHTVSVAVGETERQALGVDVSEGQQLGWDPFPWSAPGISWTGVTDAAAFKSFLVRRLSVMIGFYDANDAVIGYRRPIAVIDVTADNDPEADEIFVEYRCRTGFGNGAGASVASVALVFRCHPADLARPGKQWLAPDEIAFEEGYDSADMKIGVQPLIIDLKQTVREHVIFTLEI